MFETQKFGSLCVENHLSLLELCSKKYLTVPKMQKIVLDNNNMKKLKGIKKIVVCLLKMKGK